MENLILGDNLIPIDPNKSHTNLSKGIFTLEGQLNNSAEQLIEQMNILANRAKQIQERKRISKIIYNSKIGFEPIVKGIYYLYIKDDGQFISMISPQEWGRKKFDYIAKICLDYDHTWEILELNNQDFFNI
jgi:hypothetical protein